MERESARCRYKLIEEFLRYETHYELASAAFLASPQHSLRSIRCTLSEPVIEP